MSKRKSRQIAVGDVLVGGDAPVSVQSMTNTDTHNIAATLQQISDLHDAGADLVRVSVPDMHASECFGKICEQSPVPLIADIHFDYKIALATLDHAVGCLRINPGNIGGEQKVSEVVSKASDKNVPIRIGVNAGSLERRLINKYGEPNPEAMMDSALSHIEMLEKRNFKDYKLSLKASDIELTVNSYKLIASQVDCPLHLGITEAGSLRGGTVKSAIGIGYLLRQGIGDTVRVSLAADPVEEVKVAWDILKSLRLRSRGVNIVACPSCSRQNFDVIKSVNTIEQRVEHIKSDIHLAIIGCYVNGPGESKIAHIGVTGASPLHLIYLNGKPFKKVDTDQLIDTVVDLTESIDRIGIEKLIAQSEKQKLTLGEG